MKRTGLGLILVISIVLAGALGSGAATYTSTQQFDEDEGIFWNYSWQQCIQEIPDGTQVDAVTVQLRILVWAWGFYPNPARIDLLCSDNTNFYAGDPAYTIASLTPGSYISPSQFYTKTYILKPNQIDWLENNKCIYFMVVANGATYYMDYATIVAETDLPRVANPSFSPSPGIYSSNQHVSISCATDGATIRYTTNGTDPTESSTLYTGSVSVSETTTLKARAFMSGYLPSDIVTGLYIIEKGDETALYLREKWILSEDKGSPVPWVTNYVYPQDGSRTLQWGGLLTGDISGTYSWNIDIVESGAAGTLWIDLVVNRDGAKTTIASREVNVPALEPGFYFPVSTTVSGTDLQTQDGDLFTLKISQVSGTAGIGIGLDGVNEWCDSHVSVYYNGPVPCFTLLPQEGDLNTEFSFDASCSSDNSYPLSDLEVRWDWDGDGTYDTAFSTEKTAAHQYTSSGVKRVKLQVRNPDGLVRTETNPVTIDMVILSSFNAPGSAPAGLAWDGSHLWFSDTHDDIIYKLTPSGEIVTSFASPCGDPLDLAWDGESLWVLDAQGTEDQTGNIIYKVDASGNTIVSFPVPRDISTGLTWDGHFLWGADSTNCRIAKIDPSSGTVIISFASPGPDPRGLAWDGEHLWVSDFTTQEIYKMDVNGNLLGTYPAPGTGPTGLAWDGEHLWCVDSHSYKIYRLTDKIPTAITCVISDGDITLGEKVTVSGHIIPALGEAGVGVSVELSPPQGDTVYRAALANINGEFEYQVQCEDITQAGVWSIRTSWAGGGPYVGAASEPAELTVAPATARITVDSTFQAIKFGETVDISGKFTPQPDCGRDLTGIPLEVHITGPGEEVTIVPVTTMDMYGHYVVHAYAGMNALGEWKVEVKFAGNGAYEASSSAAVRVRVVETAGYAVVVQGKIENGEGQPSHRKTVDFVYRRLKARGLLDDDIKYFTYDTGASGFDAVPSKAGLAEAVTQWARNKMNAKPASLYLVMVDHGYNDVFYMHPDTVSASELGSWLDMLQENLNEQAATQEIIVLLGFCRSGSFIDNLSGGRRNVIASAAANESSYKGPLDADGIRDGEFFISEFFKSVAVGKSVKESFEEAAKVTERFTSAGTGSVNAPYFDDSRQHPLLDDNGDGVGSNDLSDPSGDGLLSKDIYIGAGGATGNDPDDVAVTQINPSVFLDEKESTANLWAKVDKDFRLRTIWTETKAPGTAPIDPEGSGQAEMNLPRAVFMLFAAPVKQYEWTNQGGFTEPGTYQVFFFAKDDVTGNVSRLKEGKVYKAKEGNSPPSPFVLISPEDGDEGLTARALVWEAATDPDGDRLTYTVFASKGDAGFTSPIVKEGLTQSACVINPSDGIEDLSTYYWKVQAIDEYGAIRESDVRTFSTNNTNPVYPGWITGRVYNVRSGQLIHGAQVQVGESVVSSVLGYYLGEVPAGAYRVTATASGYVSKSYEGVVIPSSDSVTKDFGLAVAVHKGDLNGDGVVDLGDAVAGLKVLLAGDGAGLIREDYEASGADMDGDGKIEMRDVLYILQSVSGMR